MAQPIDLGVGAESGLADVQESRAKRNGNAAGKPQLSLIFEFPKALSGVALSLKDGADKYNRGDWKRGFPQDEMIDSLLRHVLALKTGEVVDPDSKSGATHYDSILANALMLSELRPEPAIQTVIPEKPRDAAGYDVSGFDAAGWHRSHDFDNLCCNCPSCR